MTNSISIIAPGQKLRLKDIDSAYTGAFKTEEEAREKLDDDIKKLNRLQEVLFAESRRSLLIIFQGMDTSGKDSMIKHVMRGINPQGCEVHSFKAPSAEELSHGYLWRCQKVEPPRGKIGIFNRSYYEEVTIARVHQEILQRQNLPPGLIDDDIWSSRFGEINAYEKYLNENGILILKFFLHISEQEQKNRILKRLNDPEKHWKFDVSDIREREYWSQYISAYEKAISNTSTKWAPWHVVPADRKWCARVAVADAIIEKLKSLNLAYPKLSEEGERNLKKARSLLGVK